MFAQYCRQKKNASFYFILDFQMSYFLFTFVIIPFFLIHSLF